MKDLKVKGFFFFFSGKGNLTLSYYFIIFRMHRSLSDSPIFVSV